MRHLYFFMLLISSLSCTNLSSIEKTPLESEKTNLLEEVTFSIDTVMVNMGDQMVDFSLGMISMPSSDSKWYYVYNKSKIQKISLDSLQLVDTLTLEKDGPNHPGAFLSFQSLPEGKFFFPDMIKPNVIDWRGIKTLRLDLNHEEIIKGSSAEPFSVINRMKYNPNLGQFYSLPLNYQTRDLYFLVLDSVGNRISISELPRFKEAEKYLIRSDNEQKGEFPFLQVFDSFVIISNTYGNGIYLYDPFMNCLSYREFPLEIVPPKKTGEIRNRVKSTREFEEELKVLNTKINYLSFLWDEKSKKFYRFATKFTSESQNEAEFYLMAFSKELELLGETKLEGLEAYPHGGFFKDGKLWSYVNVNDELGFAVMDFKF